MPSLGADMESGTLIEWLVKPGDRVHRGDIVAVVETDKGAIEIEIFEDAIVAELLVALDTEVPVGTPLARLDKVGEHAAAAPVQPAVPARAELRPPPAPPTATPAPRPAAPPAAARRSAVARRDAAKDLAGRAPARARTRHRSRSRRRHRRWRGGDRRGRRTVGRYGGASTCRAIRRAAPRPRIERPTTIEPTAMRRAIASAMSRSKREIPHYYLAHTIDLEPALTWLERRNAQRPIEQRLVYGVLLLKAVARAVAEAPSLNGYWRDDAFVAADAVESRRGDFAARRRARGACAARRGVARRRCADGRIEGRDRTRSSGPLEEFGAHVGARSPYRAWATSASRRSIRSFIHRRWRSSASARS